MTQKEYLEAFNALDFNEKRQVGQVVGRMIETLLSVPKKNRAVAWEMFKKNWAHEINVENGAPR